MHFRQDCKKNLISSIFSTFTNLGIKIVYFSQLFIDFILCITNLKVVSHWTGIHYLGQTWVTVEQEEVWGVFG